MELGDKVVAYTHEASDLGPDVVRDELAFVTGLVDDEGKCVDVVIFAPRGPLRFERLCQYDPDYLYTMPGGSYFRAEGEKAPNFDKTMPHSTDPEWNALVARHINERDVAQTQAQKDALLDRHKKEQDQLRQQLDERKSQGNGEKPKGDKPKQEGERR